MKRFFALILAIVLIVPALAFADVEEPDEKYQTFGATEDINNIFPGKYFSIDLFTSFDLNAYIQIMTWNGHDVTTITKHGAIKTKVGENGIFYILFADGSYYTYHYDDEFHTALWLDIDGVSIKMTYSQWLVPITDVKVN